jgi:hypothetical protein
MVSVCSVQSEDAKELPVSVHDRDFFFLPFKFECSLSAEEENEASLFSITVEQCNIAAIACLFNLVLCYHFEWSKQKKQSALLSKALYYYDKAYSMLNIFHYLRPTDPFMQAVMAVCNNAAHCLVELADQQMFTLWNIRLCQALRLSARGTMPENHCLIFSSMHFTTAAAAA